MKRKKINFFTIQSFLKISSYIFLLEHMITLYHQEMSRKNPRSTLKHFYFFSSYYKEIFLNKIHHFSFLFKNHARAFLKLMRVNREQEKSVKSSMKSNENEVIN